MSDSKSGIPIAKGKIKEAIEMGVPISIKTYTVSQEIAEYITNVACTFLELIHQKAIQDYVAYCLHELITNAKKANTKRVYFKIKGLDINDENSYIKGMKTFKEESLNDLDYYLQQQKKEGLYVKVSMQAKQNSIIIEVMNNVALVAFERQRIFERIRIAHAYKTVNEALLHRVDTTEGAGLGFIIMLLMLKKIGLQDDALKIITAKDLTLVRITIPRHFEVDHQFVELTHAVVDYIENLPQFPEKIIQIQRLINDPNATLANIASLINNDIALTADLLKLVNSAAFGLSKKCMNIMEAVKLAGLRAIQNLLYSVGTLQILGNDEQAQKDLWRQAYKSAFFAYHLAKKYRKNSIVDDIYVCALLHKLGKFVLNLMYPHLLSRITEIQKEKHIAPEVVNRVLSGMEHHVIGTLLAEKWNLPAIIVAAIKYQYEPEKAPKKWYELIATISLTDAIIHYYAGIITYRQIPIALLQLYHITDEQQLYTIAENLNTAFEKQRC